MIHPQLLTFWIGEMDAERVDLISIAHLKALAALEAYAKEAGRADRPETIAAAVAVVAPESPAAIICDRFGKDVVPIFVELVENSRSLDLYGWAEHLRRVVDREGDQPVGFAALGALHALAEKAVEWDELSHLRHCLRKAELYAGQSQLPALRKLRTCVESKMLTAKPEAIATTVLSWSIDIAGSTKLKTRIRALAKDESYRRKLYGIFCDLFLKCESEFYKDLFRADKTLAGDALDWRKLFTVKGMGDEIWLLYEVPKGDPERLRSAIARLVGASMTLVETPIHLAFGERNIYADEDFERELDQRHDSMDLFCKVYGDVLEDGIDTSPHRLRHFEGKLRSLLGKEPGLVTPKLGADELDLANRLNVARFHASGLNSLRITRRTDYIGHDVDRFFRATKYAQPRVVTLGESLFALGGFSMGSTACAELSSASVALSSATTGLATLTGLLHKPFDIRAEGLKGIEYPYRVHHLTNQEQLLSLHHSPEKDNPILDATRKIFTFGLVESLRTPR